MSKETKITLEYFGMSGEGATVKEAKADAGRKLERAMNMDCTPVVFNWRGQTGVMSGNPKYGFGYRLIHNELPVRFSASHCSCGFADRQDCELALVKHLADLVRKTGETTSELFDYTALNSGVIERAKREFAKDAVERDRINGRYNRALAIGLDRDVAHSYALGNPAFQLAEYAKRFIDSNPALYSAATELAAEVI